MSTHTHVHTHTSGYIVASVVEQEVAGELEKRERKRWYWRCRRRC
jgi:hypothetical protein